MDQKMAQGAKMNSWVKGINAITLFVNDLEAASQFYQTVFDLPLVFTDNDSSVFKLGDTLINLLKSSAADELIHPAKVGRPEDGSRFVFTVRVDDVDKMCTELTLRGVKLLNGPMDRPWGPRTASFIDPGGYIWEIAS